MYEYKFVKVELKGNILNINLESKRDYREIIKEHAENGWKLSQIFSPGTFEYGSLEYFELIFERKIEN
ncbi:DUF4177 domain-containing protein [Bacillus bingmayongensis]|uniref:DUF4177 domain-containing protein n=1 Tax=Bacillus bingmayongensis TaxID=1150157 RepID=UPI0002D48D61|nr:DUF4177 domain-containing protein [Bacillus bingmayongensis]